MLLYRRCITEKISTIHHILSRLAAAVAVISVILAGISKLIAQTLWITDHGYMTVAMVALLFAIYFVVEGWADAAKEAK